MAGRRIVARSRRSLVPPAPGIMAERRIWLLGKRDMVGIGVSGGRVQWVYVIGGGGGDLFLVETS